MATKKTAEPETKEEMTEQTVEKPYDPWKDMRQVYVPMRSRGEQRTLLVGVNDRSFAVPKGQWCTVPMPVWEVINHMQDQIDQLEREAEKDFGTHDFGTY